MNALSKKLTLHLGSVQGDGEANLEQESLLEAQDSRPLQDTEAGPEGIHHPELEFNINSCEV